MDLNTFLKEVNEDFSWSIKDGKLRKEIHIGGYSGGSCWDNSPSQPYSNDISAKDMEFTDLEEIVEKYRPEITYLRFKKLEREMISSDTYSEGEYYGNSTTYLVLSVDLEKLHKFLFESS